MIMEPLNLEAIKKSLRALTDFDGEEWQVFYDSTTKEPVAFGPDNFTEEFRVDGMSEADATFAAAAPETVKALVAEVERLRQAHTAEGVAELLGAEDRGLIIDALVEHADMSRRRKAMNSASSSDERADQCDRLILLLGDPALNAVRHTPSDEELLRAYHGDDQHNHLIFSDHAQRLRAVAALTTPEGKAN